jgi:geranylgeranyl pyrophosphate synthase
MMIQDHGTALVYSTSTRNEPIGYDDVKRIWGDEIERRIEESIAADGLMGEICCYAVKSGGKRVRAILPVWACANLGGRPDSALDIGAAFEIIHNASLVHDDLQDGDRHRRGRPTVWHRWGAAHAVSAGDALIFLGISRLLRAPDAVRTVGMAQKALALAAEGQIIEVQLRLPGGHPDALYPTLARWEDMARKKTGQLFSACLRAGAIAARADAETVECIGEYGESLGLFFQVQDDYLDLVGDKGRECRGTDLLEGKVSFPIAWAYEHAAASDVAFLRRVVEGQREEKTPAMVAEALALLERTGALDATAAWLKAAHDAAVRHPMAEVLPVFATRLLSPVAHALLGGE